LHAAAQSFMPRASICLLDDPFFVAELEKLDLPPIDDRLLKKESEPYWVTDVAPPSRDEDAAPIRIGAGVFVALMCIGAGAAAAIFHDRLALLLR
jgi:hypothetical protein